jgi:hypothetical protein
VRGGRCGTRVCCEPFPEGQFGPHRLAHGALRDAPGLSEERHEDQASASVGVRVGDVAELAVTAWVTHLDAESGLGEEQKAQLEVPSRDPAVGDGVGGELGDQVLCGVVQVAGVWVSPGVELGRGEVAGQAGATRGGAEALGQFGGGGGDFGVHVTERGGLYLRWPGVTRRRCVAVRVR